MKALIASWNIWKLAIFRLFTTTFVAGATAFITSMSGLKWEMLDMTDKCLIGLGVLIVMANNINAFLDRTIERISQGKPLVGGEAESTEKIKL